MKTIIVKIGSSVIFTENNRLDIAQVNNICGQILALKGTSNIVIVLSGAISCGAKEVDIKQNDSLSKQLAAGVGQIELISAFNTIFAKKGIRIAQVLITEEIFHEEIRSNQFRQFLNYCLEQGVIPVLNENDVLSLNGFGGNDYLAAEIVELIGGDSLVMLSTMKGSKFGVGGGESKIEVMNRLKKIGLDMTIVDGRRDNILLETVK